MSLLNLFRKKETKEHFVPTNQLETLLVEACEDPAQRPEFLRKLFHFDLFLVGELGGESDESRTVGFATANFEGEPTVFGFTSEAALSWYLRERKLPPQKFVKMSSLSFFKMINGKMGLLLNPSHSYCKHFALGEIDGILNSSLENYSYTVPKGTEFLIGQPKEKPEKLIATVRSYVQRNPNLKNVYFGLISWPDGRLEYLGISEFLPDTSEREKQRIIEDLIRLAKETLPSNKSISFAPLDNNSNYLNAISEGALVSVVQ